MTDNNYNKYFVYITSGSGVMKFPCSGRSRLEAFMYIMNFLKSIGKEYEIDDMTKIQIEEDISYNPEEFVNF